MYNIFITLFILLLILLNFKNSIYNIETFNNDVYDKINIIYYINLKERTDRNKDFLDEMNKLDLPISKIQRIDAIKHYRGEVGCSYSHIKTLEEFIQSSYNNCIIFEDDFSFSVSKDEFTNLLDQVFINNIDYDVIMLSGSIIDKIPSNYDFLDKVIEGQTASGYLVSKKFAKNLLDNYIESVQLLENNSVDKYEIYGLDQYWKKLQPNNNWYVFNPKVGYQRESFSDIHKVVVSYNV